MSTVGVGIDVVDVPRFELAMKRRPSIVARLFTDAEQRDTNLRPERLAARFAAKEAVLKTLGVGVGAARWTSIEVVRSSSGAPSVQLHEEAAELAKTRGVEQLHVSLSHTAQTAMAFVVGSN